MFSKIMNFPLVRRYREDYRFRTAVNTVCSSTVTTAIGCYNLVFGLLGGRIAVWLFALAAYYLSLALARIVVLTSWMHGLRKNENALESEIRSVKNYLGGGGLLVLLTASFSVILVLVTARQYHYEYHGFTIYVMAVYAFAKIIIAFVTAVKYKKRYDDYMVQTFRNYNLADGLVSVVALQSAMLSHFNDGMSVMFATTMNACVGSVVAILIFALSTYMIVRGAHTLYTDERLQEDGKRAAAVVASSAEEKETAEANDTVDESR